MLYIDVQHAMVTSEGASELNVRTEVGWGELMCLFGPSGAGKTTLLRMLAGLVRPDRGRIVFGDRVWFDSEKRIHLSPQERKVGFMFQDYALFPNMTVEGNIRYVQKAKDPGQVEELLALFGLIALANRKPHQLSGGQKQRVALARALAAQPNLLMLDEPLSALDPEMRLSLREEIRKAHHLLQSVSLMVSHDVDEIRSLADSVLVLRNGCMVEKNKPALVFPSEPKMYVFPSFSTAFLKR
jgi:molybdate transport system ATP-binding protein